LAKAILDDNQRGLVGLDKLLRVDKKRYFYISWQWWVGPVASRKQFRGNRFNL